MSKQYTIHKDKGWKNNEPVVISEDHANEIYIEANDRHDSDLSMHDIAEGWGYTLGEIYLIVEHVAKERDTVFSI